MISKGILQESVEKIRISFQGNFVNALRPRNQSTVLFPNYQNNNWTIKRWNDARISPVRHCWIFRTLEFVLRIASDFGFQFFRVSPKVPGGCVQC